VNVSEADCIRVAAVQMTSTEDIDANLATADRLVRAGVRDGAALVVLPEKWNLHGRGEVERAHAQPLDGASGLWAADLAAELEIDLIAGSITEDVAGRSRAHNTSVHYGPDGTAVAVYRKMHMFDVEVDGTHYAESDTQQPGDQVVASGLGGSSDSTVRVGLSICYDLRFPELYRAYAGVELIAVPAAFTLATTRDHWELLLRARAVENQAFVIAPNQIGEYLPGQRCGGRSLICDPWGVVLAMAPDSECHIVADLDLNLLGDIRQRLPALTHRRPETLYRQPETAAWAGSPR
jgi:predicted amidohydrolase